MPLYRIGPLRLRSTRRLPELQPLARTRPTADEWTVMFVPRLPRPRARVDWFHEWNEPTGRRWLRIGRTANGYVVQVQRLARFLIDRTARRMHVCPGAGVPPVTLRHLLLDQVVPMLLADADHLVLHASAVVVGGRAVACVGESGAGKSTVAAWLLAHGHTLVTDDCLVVDVAADRPCVVPMSSGLRLWPDSLQLVYPETPVTGTVAHYSRKRRVPIDLPGGPSLAPPASLGAIYLLSRTRDGRGRVLGRRVRGRDAFMALLRCTFHLDVNRHATAARALDRVARLVARVPVYAVDCPAGLEFTPAVARLVARSSAMR